MSIDLAALIAATPPGMAHATGTGPADTTCRTCAFWAGNQTEIVSVTGGKVMVLDHSRRRWEGSALPSRQSPAPQACFRYRQIKRSQLDSNDRSKRVPHNMPSCSHYRAYAGEAQAELRMLVEGIAGGDEKGGPGA